MHTRRMPIKDSLCSFQKCHYALFCNGFAEFSIGNTSISWWSKCVQSEVWLFAFSVRCKWLLCFDICCFFIWWRCNVMGQHAFVSMLSDRAKSLVIAPSFVQRGCSWSSDTVIGIDPDKIFMLLQMVFFSRTLDFWKRNSFFGCSFDICKAWMGVHNDR